jgi:phage terminase Nu1 subunit (DNA packaging protein)
MGGSNAPWSWTPRATGRSRTQLEYREKAAALVEASEVEPAIVKEFARCRDRLLRLPADCARRCPGLAPAAVAAVDALVREALEGLDDVIERGGKL